jgi:hypothetical protein
MAPSVDDRSTSARKRKRHRSQRSSLLYSLTACCLPHFVQRPGLSHFVPAGGSGRARSRAGARLLRAPLSSRPLRSLRSQRHALFAAGVRAAARSGCTDRVSVRLPPLSIRPLLCPRVHVRLLPWSIRTMFSVLAAHYVTASVAEFL